YKGMYGLPDRIDIREFIGQKLHDVENAGNSQHKRIRQHMQVFRQIDQPKSLQQPQGGYRGIQVQPGGKSCAKNETQCFQWIHSLPSQGMNLGGTKNDTTKDLRRRGVLAQKQTSQQGAGTFAEVNVTLCCDC